MSSEATRVQLKIYQNRRLVFSTDLDAPMEVGRQRVDEPEPYQRISESSGVRLVIAKREETSISRNHARFAPQPDGKVQITNLSAHISLPLHPHELLAAGESRNIELPALLTMGDKVVRLEQAVLDDDLRVERLSQPTLAPGTFGFPAGKAPRFLTELVGGNRVALDQDSLMQWLQAVLGVFQSAASSPRFLPDAAMAVAEIVDLDFAAILLWDGQQWKSEAFHARGQLAAGEQWQPSRTILERLRREQSTLRHVPSSGSQPANSLMNVRGLVAAPILDTHGDVIGAIYGDRRQARPGAPSPLISELEAKLVDLLACGVAGGLARLEQEKHILAARVQFEQFFTPELARKLEAEPDLLSGRDAEASLLFCDITGFSRISERLGPKRTVDWIKDVMTALSDCVIVHQGVLVDYIGDELVAMWGAPSAIPNHAELACRAALAMIKQLPQLNQRWEPILGEPMGFGIGINSGMARVGNIGTDRKFKYGPLGNTVNLASRVQGATKYLRTKLLVTGDTARHLDGSFSLRRLCRVRMVNIAEPVELYELAAEVPDNWHGAKSQYEEALDAFERGDCLVATSILGKLLVENPNDAPSLLLLSRAVDMLAHVRERFDPVWELAGK